MRGHSTFEGFIVNATPRAIAFCSNYWESFLWLPKSQIRIENDGDFSVVVHIKDWLCNKRGISEFTTYTMEEIEAIAGVEK